MSATEAMQNWLALEHESVWLYPVIGARFDQLTQRAREAHDAHLSTRDHLLARLHTLDIEPVPAKLSYAVGSLSSPQVAIKLARRLEQAIAAACLDLAGESSEQGDQKYAITRLRRAARAEMAWGGEPRAFPGLAAQS
ncbi:hypothetical protein J2X11_002224 [Aeromicrobium panaciterrae]|uniref:DUF4439 domain-containing protein n=1 Tax=Aeromicrobium panaciterrae TaxID=363861 RepID=A0ABU1UQG0_9ACTN|nr:DUF4439 domain-containing protein [Aeromicrobium panaciterrae]MDR7087385.1 hypothetical protein [Aeromicrobium panaciterrae]